MKVVVAVVVAICGGVRAMRLLAPRIMVRSGQVSPRGRGRMYMAADEEPQPILTRRLREAFQGNPDASGRNETASDEAALPGALQSAAGLDAFFNLFEDISDGFDLFDADGDGRVTIDEMGDVMHSLGHNPTEADLEAMMSAYDTDGSGTIEFDEFLSLLMSHQDGPLDERSALMVEDAARQALSERMRRLAGLTDGE